MADRPGMYIDSAFDNSKPTIFTFWILNTIPLLLSKNEFYYIKEIYDYVAKIEQGKILSLSTFEIIQPTHMTIQNIKSKHAALKLGNLFYFNWPLLSII